MTSSSATPTKRPAAEPPRDQSTGKRSRFGGALRKAGLALGIFGLAWIVSRRVRSGDGMPSTGEIRDRAVAAMPDAAAERVGGETADETSDEWTERGSRGPVSGAGDEGGTGPGGTSRIGSAVDRTMTDEAVAGRLEHDVQEEPAPPGEMNVDDEVAEEVLGEDARGGDGDQSDAETAAEEDEPEMLGQDETDMEGDEDE